MENTTARSFNTQLKDRLLWYDGDSSFDASNLISLMAKHSIKYVDEINESVKQFNKYCSKNQQLKVKESCRSLSYEWNIPEEYKKLDVVEYLFQQHIKITKNLSKEEAEKRDIRLIEEIKLYKEKGLFDVLRTIIYIINTLSSKQVVWGVGRGSSVSSYVLYVIGVHDVDSYMYNLPIDDFIN